MIASIDRFEGDLAVIITDGEEQIILPKDRLYPNAQQHDIVDISGDPGCYTVVYLPEETQKRKEKIEALFNKLRKKK
ncbi:MAG: DUF3006 domain-containing protein [Clostridia bacterium]|nr:DUF3006 domain-containing protein [Clostridia bacterium]